MVLQCLRLRIMADSERVNWSAERVPGQPTDRATSSSSSTGTLGIVARTIKAPSSQPPTLRMIGYADRSTALALSPKRPRLYPPSHPDQGKHSHRRQRERQRDQTLATSPKVHAGVKSTVSGW